MNGKCGWPPDSELGVCVRELPATPLKRLTITRVESQGFCGSYETTGAFPALRMAELVKSLIH